MAWRQKRKSNNSGPTVIYTGCNVLYIWLIVWLEKIRQISKITLYKYLAALSVCAMHYYANVWCDYQIYTVIQYGELN